MDNLLQCAICFEMFNNTLQIPRILNCGHTYCTKCLIDMSKANNQNENNNSNIQYNNRSLLLNRHQQIRRLICPLDKKVGFDNMSIDDIPINRLILDIINVKENKDEIEKYEKKINDYEYTIQKERESIISKIQSNFEHLTKIFINERDRLVNIINNWYQSEVRMINVRKKNIKSAQGRYIMNNEKEFQFPLFEINQSINNSISELLNSFSLIIPSNEIEQDEEANDDITNSVAKNRNSFSLFSMHDFDNNNDSNTQFTWFQPHSSIIYQYSLLTAQWVKTQNRSQVILTEMFRQCNISHNQVLITGGIRNFQCSSEVFLYANNTFVQKQSMLSERRAHSIIKVDDIVYVMGGIGISNKEMNHCESYTISAGQWRSIKEMPQSKSHTGVCAVQNQCIYIIGGETENDVLSNSIEKYTINTNNWVSLSVILPFPLECCSCIYKKKDKSVVILGGFNSEFGKLKTIFEFSPSSNTIINGKSTLEVEGWSVFNPILINNVIHLFIGGEDEELPLHLAINY